MYADAAVLQMQNTVGVTRERRCVHDWRAVMDVLPKFLKFLKLLTAALSPPPNFAAMPCKNKKLKLNPLNWKDKKMKNNLKQHDKINIMVPFFVIIQVFICNNLPIAAVSS